MFLHVSTRECSCSSPRHGNSRSRMLFRVRKKNGAAAAAGASRKLAKVEHLDLLQFFFFLSNSQVARVESFYKVSTFCHFSLMMTRRPFSFFLLPTRQLRPRQRRRWDGLDGDLQRPGIRQHLREQQVRHPDVGGVRGQPVREKRHQQLRQVREEENPVSRRSIGDAQAACLFVV